MIKKDLIIAVLATFCLTSTLFIVMPTRSSSNSFPYDPWLDLNDDGIIDIYDETWMLILHDAKGTPINKTELLYEVNATYTRLLSRIDSLNASLLTLEAYLITRITTLEALVADQQSRIAKLESDLAILNATKLGKPDYDSEWTYIVLNDFHIFNHNLDTTNVIVYLMGYDVSSGAIHQAWYGGEINGNWWAGVCWQELTTTTIKVFRHANDDGAAFSWDYTRVLIWKIL